MLWGIANYCSDQEVIYFLMYIAHSGAAPLHIHEFKRMRPVVILFCQRRMPFPVQHHQIYLCKEDTEAT